MSVYEPDEESWYRVYLFMNSIGKLVSSVSVCSGTRWGKLVSSVSVYELDRKAGIKCICL